MVENRATSLNRAGIPKDSMKEAVEKKLVIGQKYRLKSMNAANGDKEVAAVCELMSLSKNFAIFKHRNGTLETITYQELWSQIVNGDLI